MRNGSIGVANIRFRATARTDLAEIRAFSAEQFGDSVADDYTRGFKIAFDLLRRHPLSGETKPEIGRGVRCLVHKRHRILYQIDRDLVLILRIVHHSRDAKRALSG